MTGRRETPHTRVSGLAATPTGTRLIVPDPNCCTPGYRLGRALGQLAADVAGVAFGPRKAATAAEA